MATAEVSKFAGILRSPGQALPELKETLSFLLQNVDDQHLLLHDQTVIRKGTQ